MKLTGDYHMHSKYSGDSKNELEKIVRRAIELGLREIAVTDHGPSHSGFGIKKEDYPKLRAEIDALNVKYPQIKVLLGLEANLMGTDGEIDIDQDMLKMNDWLNVGYHFGSNLTRDYKWHYYNFCSKFSKKYYELAKKMNTESMIQAMRKNNITMITHPGAKGPIDIEAVAEVAAETQTMLEINSSHGHLTTEAIKKAMKYPVVFVINSDAHTIDEIGEVSEGMRRAKLAEIPYDKLYNVLES